MSNQAIEKLSPFKELTDEQAELVDDVIDFARKHLEQDHPAVYTILGDAGTGKSVVLSQLFARIQKAARIQADSPFYGTHNYFLVNHPEVLKVYKQIAGPIKTLLKKDYQRPTTFINQLDKRNETSDIVVIDEAHLLLSKPDHYNNFYHENQLVEIIKRAKVVILVFDPYQVLRMKSFWTLDRLNELVAPYPHQSYRLKHQFRMTASDELIDWFNNLTDGQIK
ncbi:DNA/RNA helicase domain-containing protein, partial [uncultured Limosilactobacillus sp.]